MDGGKGRRVVPPSVESEVEEEFSHHVEMRVKELVASGWSEVDARAEAVERFGDMERVKADCRELGTRRDVRMNRRLWLDEVGQDLKYAFRQLRRAPSFALITIVTLGIAIGANTAVFSVMNGVLLAPLPYPEPEELSVVWTRYLPPSGFDIDKFALSGPEFLDYREQTTTMASLGAYRGGTSTLTGSEADAERIRIGFFSAEVAPTLGVEPALGRSIAPEDDVPDGPAVVVLSHELWATRYGSDPDILGRSIVMNGRSTEVIGVMPEDFDFPFESRAWVPLRLDRTSQGGRAGHGYSAVGRLAPGATHADVDAELEVVRAQWAEAFEHNEAHHLWAQDMHTEIVGDSKGRLMLLMTAVGLVLLIACANIANLLMARAERRKNEVALRSTLGAGRSRIMRQLATESLVLAGVSAVVGLALAHLGVRALVGIDPDALPRLQTVSVDASALTFTMGVALVAAGIFGVLPAVLAGRRAAPSLAGSTNRSVGGQRAGALRSTLVTGEVALSLVVVILAGLVVRSFDALTSVDPRMDPEGVMTFTLTLPTASYPNDDQVPGDFERLLEEVRAIPGVSAASITTNLPFSGTGQWDFELDDRPERQDGEVARNAGISQVGPDYFETMGIPILEGRGLSRDDVRDGPLVAVVSETMASRFWPGESVIGKRFGYLMSEDSIPWMTIVGLVTDPVTASVEQERYPHVYVPYTQSGISTYFMPRGMQVAVRTSLPPESLVPDLRRTVQAFDTNLPLYRLETMDQIVGRSLAGPRVTTNLLATFAVIALVLAVVGIYGVISYSVAGRTREIGVRIALGAERQVIRKMILSEGARPILVGIAVGLGVAWFASRLVEALLFGVSPTDPITFVTLPALLLLVGTAASLVPAIRATRVTPTEALRDG